MLLLSAFGFSQQKDIENLPINSNVKEIIVICKTHFDIGYTHRVEDLMEYYRTMIDKALDVMENTSSLPKEQQFVWTAPGWVVAKVLEDWDGQTPEHRNRIEEAFKSGRIVTHAIPFTLESESVFPEDISWGYDFSKFVCEAYNLPMPRDAKIDSHYVGASDRAPCFQTNTWESLNHRVGQNNKYYIPLTKEDLNKSIEVFVLDYYKENLDFKPEPWI